MSNLPDFVVAVPARYASQRLPGKPLRKIAGVPMIVRVCQRALAAGAREVVVATDDARIADALDGNGVEVVMTRADHASGTDRLAELARLRAWQEDLIVVNLQGDEPQAPVSGIQAVAQALAASYAPMATLATPIQSIDELFDPNCVKLVRGGSGNALYFSRAPIPWARDAMAPNRHALPAKRALPAPHRHLCLSRGIPRPLCFVAAYAPGNRRVAGTIARARTWACHPRCHGAGVLPCWR
jgi:3-deoxy-manno-octulosonate cytidylyltransferase (CMP-KDO synthetase)